jgi:hypothetical protein
MKDVNELVDLCLFDIDLNDNIEDYKEKVKNVIIQMNSLIENTNFEIRYGEMNSEKAEDVVFLTLMIKLPKD